LNGKKKKIPSFGPAHGPTLHKITLKMLDTHSFKPIFYFINLVNLIFYLTNSIHYFIILLKRVFFFTLIDSKANL